MWAEVLELEHVGVTTTSSSWVEFILATRALSRIREELGVELSLAGFFLRPTISSLSQHINELIDRAPITRPPVSTAGSQRLPLSPSGEDWFLDQ